MRMGSRKDSVTESYDYPSNAGKPTAREPLPCIRFWLHSVEEPCANALPHSGLEVPPSWGMARC